MKSALITLIFSGLLLVPATVTCEEKKEAPAKASPVAMPAAPAPKAPAPAQAAPRIVVAIDPETGELRAPTPEELQALSTDTLRILKNEGGTTTVETLPGGMKRARLGPEYLRWSVVKRNPDGTLTFDCLPMKGLPSAPASPAPAEK